MKYYVIYVEDRSGQKYYVSNIDRLQPSYTLKIADAIFYGDWETANEMRLDLYYGTDTRHFLKGLNEIPK